MSLVLARRYSKITTAPILHLHRHQDGYITFATMRDGEDFRPLISVRASELERWFPAFREQLEKDSYVSINADWRLRKHGPDGNAYGYPLHRCDCLRYINACYVDIDFHRLGLDFGTVIGRVLNWQEVGQLPHASMIVRSGHGVWLLWLIHDIKNADLSQRAFRDKLELYSRIQAAIVERLLPLGADMAARDAARHLRIPGSLNSGSETNVEWWTHGANESGYIYTLPQLAKLFRAILTKRHHREIIAHNPAKRRGWVALNAKRLRNFNALRALRGGFSDGCRNNAAKIYAWLLRANGVPRSDVLGLLTDMGEQCRPRLSKAEIKNAWKYNKIRRMKDQTIADWLDVTQAEAEMMEGLPPARRFNCCVDPPAPMPRELQRQVVQDRRAAIQAIIAEVGRVPPVRKMARLLSNKGFRCNHQTAFKDYKALGIKWERTRDVRKDKKSAPLAAGPGSLLMYAEISGQDLQPEPPEIGVIA